MLFLVSDHGGFKLKQRLVAWLRRKKIAVVDLGPERLTPGDDYPVAASQLAQSVAKSPKHFGIAICRTGVGMAVVANKHPRIRAVQALTPAIASRSRQDENTNVLSLAADYQRWPDVTKTVSRWLATPFRGQVRHTRRLREIKKLEHGR